MQSCLISAPLTLIKKYHENIHLYTHTRIGTNSNTQTHTHTHAHRHRTTEDLNQQSAKKWLPWMYFTIEDQIN